MTDLTPSQPPAALGYRMPAEWEPHVATWIAWPHNRSDWPGKFGAIPFVYAEIVRHLARSERVNILVNDEAAEVMAREVLVRAAVLPEQAVEPGKASSNAALREVLGWKPKPADPKGFIGALSESFALSDVEGHVESTWKPRTVAFARIPTNRVWTRDYGPIFVKRRPGRGDGLPNIAATAWRFNAWAKYNDWKLDAPVSAKLAERLRLPNWKPLAHINGKPQRVVLEGGSIEVNGRGTMITTEECLLTEVQQRNPGLSRGGLERLFADFLGVRKVIWLERGIAGDDTHGHVDDITRFVAPSTVLTAYEEDRSDANHEPLRENFRKLSKSSDQSGRPLRIIKLPMPAPVVFRGQRLPASYANFYIANRVVLVPVFNDPKDRVALNTIAEAFPKREVVGIYCGDFIWGLGALHCMTQQQPAG